MVARELRSVGVARWMASVRLFWLGAEGDCTLTLLLHSQCRGLIGQRLELPQKAWTGAKSPLLWRVLVVSGINTVGKCCYRVVSLRSAILWSGFLAQTPFFHSQLSAVTDMILLGMRSHVYRLHFVMKRFTNAHLLPRLVACTKRVAAFDILRPSTRIHSRSTWQIRLPAMNRRQR
ncbi:hypothetical protein EV421DRAFT_276365 [Armillaria borealis]|uniref:Uncharacterized protein n=1 Tax=Armillaria borealis TaxID=47425 RepID=A0AA39IVX0_9AGAR|nr:hypothetical protein EV421DRAFT_276365 [Armillaria borealis]